MGKVDISSLYLCGDRMNGVLIEWSVWPGNIYTILFSICFFVFFCFFAKTYKDTSLFTKHLYPKYILLWGYN